MQSDNIHAQRAPTYFLPEARSNPQYNRESLGIEVLWEEATAGG